MADKFTPEFAPPLVHLIGEAFVLEYYHVLNNKPQDLHLYYGRSSTITRAHSKVHEIVETRASTEEAMRKILSFVSGWKAQITSVVSQESLPDRVLILVTGYFSKPESVRRNFIQIFLLGLQNGDNYLRNDVLRLSGAENGEAWPCFSCTLDREEDLRLSELHSAFQKDFKVIPQLDLKTKCTRQAVLPRKSSVLKRPVLLKHPPETRHEWAESFCSLPFRQPPQELVQAWAECERNNKCSDTSDSRNSWEELESIGFSVPLPRAITTASTSVPNRQAPASKKKVIWKDERVGHDFEETLILDDKTEFATHDTFGGQLDQFPFLRYYPQIPMNLYGSS